MGDSAKYVVWQWNCRGFGKKRGNLQQFMNNKEEKDRPDVIALQEARQLAKLSGYKSYGTDAKDKTQVVTLVKRNVPVIVHDTGISTVEHVLVEIISGKKKGSTQLIRAEHL